MSSFGRNSKIHVRDLCKNAFDLNQHTGCPFSMPVAAPLPGLLSVFPHGKARRYTLWGCGANSFTETK
jgi:hypothetical protein